MKQSILSIVLLLVGCSMATPTAVKEPVINNTVNVTPSYVIVEIKPSPLPIEECKPKFVLLPVKPYLPLIKPSMTDEEINLTLIDHIEALNAYIAKLEKIAKQ